MCDHVDAERSTPAAMLPLSRRQALGLGAALAAATVLPAAPTLAADGRPQPPTRRRTVGADVLQPSIHPRSDWAGPDQPVRGELIPEDDVRFLLVHHTASTNDYGPDDVIEQIRIFYDLHTGPDKGWPDVAYNFLIDRFGGIWEARAGSIGGPVRGDATGGSQGFALLCSLIGNHAEAPMTAEQQEALVSLLAWLGASYEVDTEPGRTVSFASRGSSLWAAGTQVTAATISGHRDMSTTTCPGDFVYDLLPEEIPSQVALLRASAGDQNPTTTSSSAPTSTDTTATTSPPTDPTTTAQGTAPQGTATTAEPGSAGGPDEAAASGAVEADERSIPLLIAGGVAAAAAVVGGVVNRVRR